MYAATKMIGMEYGMRSKLTHWVYTQIAIPKMSYCAFAWWRKNNPNRTAKLDQVTNVTVITGAIYSSPIPVMHKVAGLTALHDHLEP
jgi:hypothetical protein